MMTNDSLISNITETISSHLPKTNYLSGIDKFLKALQESSSEFVDVVDHSAHAQHLQHIHNDHAMMDHSAHQMMDHSAHQMMDHSGHQMMDHSGHQMMDHSGHMMKMWFHGGYDEVILFDFWRINSLSGLILSCLLIFAMASLYEGIKWFRVYLQLSFNSSPSSCPGTCDAQSSLLNDSNPNSPDAYVAPNTSQHTPNSPSRTNEKVRAASPFDPMRLAQTSLLFICGGYVTVAELLKLKTNLQALLYAIQLTLAYWLMLIAMTYNSWLTAAVVLGAAFGHWLFAILKCLNPRADQMDTFATDACH
ncbi:unnamed protein product [Anisakis simplex]|uniref:Copper transport protein n=1 Tax=Anisakis simplex TaxID=6269 RepID=A0A0M3JTT8_ANISI|nr:unnamed protein product [Anisakis simplex]